MKNEIKVGEYCRTAGGRIFKVSEVETFSGCNYIPKDENKTLVVSAIVKHSSNLIDIIEEGDYVNGILVTRKQSMLLWAEIKGIDGIVYHIPISQYVENIKSIVTKERFEDVSYKVKE